MNASFDLIRFEFSEPLHISNARSDYAKSEEGIRSDTLAAAVMQSWATLGKQEWINAQPGFVTTSLFPFTTVSGNFIYFFPKPVKDQTLNHLPPGSVKSFKIIRYYEKELFEERLHGRLNVELNEMKEAFLTRSVPAGDTAFCKKSVIPRIMRPRDDKSDTRIFYMERRTFKKGAGLFCLASFKDNEWKQRFIKGLSLLAENGLGSDRTVGNGRFRFTEDTLELKIVSDSDHIISLSLFLPESEESLKKILDDESRYELIRRGGWISEPFNTLRKRSIHMFAEGSVFNEPAESFKIKGKVVNVKPLSVPSYNAIYRSGQSIFLPIKIN